MLAAHYSDERGVALDSRSWLITARRRRSQAEAERRTPATRGATSDGVEDEVEAAGEARVVVTGRAAASGAPEGGVGVGLGLVERLLERSPARRGGSRRLAAGAAEHVGEEEVVGVLRVVLVETGVLESVEDRVGEA